MNISEENDIYSQVIRFFDPVGFQITPSGYQFVFHQMFAPFREIRQEFESRGFHIFLRRRGQEKFGILVRIPPQKPDSPRVPLLLLGLTFITTTWAGANYSYSLVRAGYISSVWVGALSFSISLLIILGGHELGHKFTSLNHRVRASGPFFIPVPPFIFPLGTMGAIIKMKSPAPDRNAEISLGANGPITGFLLSIPILILGIKLSPIVDYSTYISGKEVLIFGEPLIFKLLKHLILNLPAGKDIILHPLAFSGWVGLFVTALNLIPLGQLDGGHVLMSIIGEKRFRRISFFIIGALFIAGLLYWEGWMFWAFIGIFFSFAGNPGPLNGLSKVGKREKIIALVCALIFALSFMPVPVKYMIIP
ncbi:MAG: site-2 protease family protein [Caldiserica bacterium]|nr:site-2 protease family protein [Caldisericota bacterium]